MTYEEIIQKWNEDADEYDQWDNLSEEEKVEFAYKTGWEDGCSHIIDM